MESTAYSTDCLPSGVVYHFHEPGISQALPFDENMYPGTDGTCLIRLVRGRGFLYRWYLGTAGFTCPDGPVARHEPDGPSICIERSVSPPPAAGMDTKVHAFLCHLIELSEDKRNVLLYNRPRSVHTTT